MAVPPPPQAQPAKLPRPASLAHSAPSPEAEADASAAGAARGLDPAFVRLRVDRAKRVNAALSLPSEDEQSPDGRRSDGRAAVMIPSTSQKVLRAHLAPRSPDTTIAWVVDLAFPQVLLDRLNRAKTTNAALATDEESSSTRGLVLSQRLADAEERLLAAGSPAMRGGSPRVAPEPATGSEGTSASSGRDSGPSDRSGGVGPRDGAMPRPPRQFMSPRPPSSPVPVGRAELQRVDRV